MNHVRQCLSAILLIWIAAVSFSGYAAVIPDKTPDDVYHNAMILKAKVKFIQQQNGIEKPWPVLPVQQGKEPHHVLEKALEILAKINRYRLNKNMGEISTSHYPGRYITPNEVYAMVVRLVDEVELLLSPPYSARLQPTSSSQLGKQEQHIPNKTPSDVYQVLWEISRALDPASGVRGFNPSDVYALSQHVVELVTFLRRSQNLPMNIPKPPLTEGRHPNHALAAVYRLQKKISQAERGLWMKPIEVPEVPRRVITPSEVYDALETVLAELQHIKFRLGLERNFETPPVVPGKTPDDVIQNVEWATQIMPVFPPNRTIVQFSQASLVKTPSHVFAVTKDILKKLQRYRRARGIQAIPRTPPFIRNLKPKHVYQKGLECLDKVNRLRQQIGIGLTSVPSYPVRAITPNEVYDLALRLDEELNIIFRQFGMSSQLFYTSLETETFNDKTPSSVYYNMWLISLQLDTVLGFEGFLPNDVYHEAQKVLADIQTIATYRNHRDEVKFPPLRYGIEPRSGELLKQVQKAQKRTGLLDTHQIVIPVAGIITPSEVFNKVRLIHAELITLKAHLGITTVSAQLPEVKDKTPADVYQVLEYAQLILESVLQDKGKKKIPQEDSKL